MKKLRGVLIDPVNNWVEDVTIPMDDLSECYRILDCNLIDHTVRKIAGKWFDIICDDEGLLVNKLPSAVNDKFEVQLVGNLFVVSGDHHECEFVSLKDDEVKHIMEHTRQCIVTAPDLEPTVLTVLTDLDSD